MTKRGPFVWTGEADALRDRCFAELAKDLAPELLEYQRTGDYARWYVAVDEAHRRLCERYFEALDKITFHIH